MNFSITVRTVGSVVHEYAAVKPAVTARPRSCCTVADVEFVPGPFVANAPRQTSISTGPADAVTPSKATCQPCSDTPNCAGPLTPITLLAVAADRALAACVTQEDPVVAMGFPYSARIKDMRNTSLEQRFWAKGDKIPDGCWELIGARDPNG